jgi:hypothetical protein
LGGGGVAWDLGSQARAAAGRAYEVQVSAEGLHPVGQAAKACPAGCVGAADAVVGDLDDESSVLVRGARATPVLPAGRDRSERAGRRPRARSRSSISEAASSARARSSARSRMDRGHDDPAPGGGERMGGVVHRLRLDLGRSPA